MYVNGTELTILNEAGNPRQQHLWGVTYELGSISVVNRKCVTGSLTLNYFSIS